MRQPQPPWMRTFVLDLSCRRHTATCAQCNTANDFDARFCKTCGTAMPKPLPTCSECGTVGDADARFCKRCGQALLVSA